jgi:hypothetical protein
MQSERLTPGWKVLAGIGRAIRARAVWQGALAGVLHARAFLSAKIQYPPDMRPSRHQVSIKVPQREGDGRQALVTSPFYTSACRLPKIPDLDSTLNVSAATYTVELA